MEESMDVYETLTKLDLALPEIPPLGGIYKPVKQLGNILFVSGQGATVRGVPAIVGKLGAEKSIEEGRDAARMCTLNCLSVLHAFLGDLNKIKSVVKVLGFVASAPDFNQQPKVIDGASQLLFDLFGENGKGARSAIGVNELPGNIAVEIEFMFEI
jgi:enamine deaminase RidA (YjgF/YER057c/UK114 family)